MKKKLIRLTEGDLHRIIKESAKKILKEIKVDYGRNTSSHHNYDWDWNPRNDRGFGYDERVNYTNSIKEDYIGLMSRLERLTGTEWNLSPESFYHSSHNQSGYDSWSESMGDNLTFSTYYSNSDRMETAKMLNLIEKVVQAFFGKENEVSVDYNGEAISVFVTGYGGMWGRDTSIITHPHSREISYGKEYAGYPMHQAKSSGVKGYNHPYPNPHNDGGNYQLANWQRFLDGKKPMSYDEWSGRGNRNYDDDEYEPESFDEYDEY